MLHHQNYSNTSKIIYCLTKDFGMVHILAKGARNKKSAFFADCQPFRLLDIQFIKKTGLSTLTSSHSASLIQFNDTKKQFSGFYINELLYRLVKFEHQGSQLFLLYLQTMDKLLDHSDIELALRWFEFNLLANLGYNFQEYLQSIELNEGNYQLTFPDMLLLSTNKKQEVDDFGGVFLQNLRSLKNINEFKKESKQFCRLVFHFLLDGKALKSRELFTAL